MKTRGYTVYSIITSVIWEAAIAAVVLLLLPKFGIRVPLWGLVSIMAGFGSYAYVSYWLGKKALEQKPMVSPQVGGKGRAMTPLSPKGYIQVDGELWKASSTGPTIHKDQEVIIVEIKGLTLFVAPVSNGEKESLEI